MVHYGLSTFKKKKKKKAHKTILVLPVSIFKLNSASIVNLQLGEKNVGQKSRENKRANEQTNKERKDLGYVCSSNLRSHFCPPNLTECSLKKENNLKNVSNQTMT
jgi:hypothetical protein